MCPVTDVVGALADIFGGAEVGADVAGGAALAGGAADAAGAFGGADAATAGLTAGAAGDAAGTIGLTDATAGLGDLAAGSAGTAATEAGLGSIAPVAGAAGGAGATSATLPELAVTAPSTAPGSVAAGGSATGGAFDAIAPVAGAGLLAGTAAGGGGSGVPAAQPSSSDAPLTASNTAAGLADTSPTLDAGGQFLSATQDGGGGLQTIDPGLASQLGIGPDPSSVLDTSAFSDNPAYGPMDVADPSTGSQLENFFKNPKNDATAGLLGISLMNALKKPKLPSQDVTASNAATSAVNSATSVIQSGGTATPEWASQKASIDATVDQQIKQQAEAIQQAAANSGEGNQNSGIVQQQIQQMTANLNVQRQQLYSQAQQQNVQAALSELSGGDSTLTAIGSTQLQQNEQAQQIAAQTAELALLLQTGGSVKIPGNTTPSVQMGS